MKVSPATRLRYAGMPSAFTLIELMVVLALIGILSAVLLPEMRGSLEEVQLRSNARKLAEACDVAFSRSVATGRILHLDWDPTRGSFHVIQDPEDSPSRRGSSSGPRSEGLIDFPGASGTIDPRITVNLQRLTSASARRGRRPLAWPPAEARLCARHPSPWPARRPPPLNSGPTGPPMPRNSSSRIGPDFDCRCD